MLSLMVLEALQPTQSTSALPVQQSFEKVVLSPHWGSFKDELLGNDRVIVLNNALRMYKCADVCCLHSVQ